MPRAQHDPGKITAGAMEAKKRGTLRGPQARRSPDAPVTMRGWLDKQGSERLRLWKTRWFVLAEFCLYYYKDAKEDKLLGSITLPSYRVCPVSQEDRVHRKFSFRIEHANMRTYYFACDTKEKMTEWMNAISLASIMQRDPGTQRRQQRSERPSVGSLEGSETGFGHRPDFSASQESVGRRDPRQPLYANAPPKPRRLTGSREASSSPEPGDRLGEMAAGAQVPSRRTPAERRTPDAYAAAPPHARADYEDVYNASLGSGSSRGRGRAAELRAHARESYASSAGRSTHMSGELCTPPPACDAPRVYGYPEPYPPMLEHGGREAPLGAPGYPSARPHSADFLEWERRAGRHGARLLSPSAGAPRPKSSLARYQPPAHDYWSEEGYANKMRQAAYSGGMVLPPAPLDAPPPTPPAASTPLVGAATLPGHGASPPPPVTHSLGRELDRVPRGSGFMRSASARFARQKARELDMMNTSLPDDPNDAREGTRKKIQQREESMKRLLEWKQRMLQSPLTRKSAKLTDAARFPPDQYRRRVRQELERSEGARTPRPQTVHGLPEPDSGDGRDSEFLPPPAQDYVNLSYRLGDGDPWAAAGQRGRYSPARPGSGVTSPLHEVRRDGLAPRKPDNRATACSHDAGRGPPARLKTEMDFRNFDKSAGQLPSDGFQQAHSQYYSQKDKYHHELHNYDHFYPTKEKVAVQRCGAGGEPAGTPPACLPPLLTARQLDVGALSELYRPESATLGKHSDSGYDTLRAELTADEAPVRAPAGRSGGRRAPPPEPRKGAAAGWPAVGWHVDDADRIDESRLVKEFSYEYVRPEKKEEPVPIKVPPKVMPKRAAAQPRQESPAKQDDSPPRNLVQERIKAFKSRLDESMATEEQMERPLRPVRPQAEVAEAQVSQLKTPPADFRETEVTTVTASEAQVTAIRSLNASLKTGGREAMSQEDTLQQDRSLSISDGSAANSLELRDIRSPQDIIDSRKSRSNIRKFALEEDSEARGARDPPQNASSVEDLLARFEGERPSRNDWAPTRAETVHDLRHDGSDSDVTDDQMVHSEPSLLGVTGVLGELRRSADRHGPAEALWHPAGSADARRDPASTAETQQAVPRAPEARWEPVAAAEAAGGSDTAITRFGPDEGAAPAGVALGRSPWRPESRAPPAVPPKPARPTPGGPAAAPIYANQPPPGSLTLNTLTEDQYLPMSPPRKMSEPAAEAAVHSRQSSANLPPPPVAPPPPPPLPARGPQPGRSEEATYMEMNANVLNLSFEASQSMFKKLSNHGVLNEPHRYSEIPPVGQQYEYMLPGVPGGEPVYMEVPSENGDTKSPSKAPPADTKIDNKRKAETKKLKGEKRKSEKKSSSADSSASDADDEGSKETDRPRNRRFSLSDTFRPASYYLQMHDQREHPDSSDSDLVSPPPIPMSPPPMDELQPGADATFSYDQAEAEAPPYLLNALLAAHSAQMTSVGGQQVVTELAGPRGSVSSQGSSQDSLARLAADIVSRRSQDSGSLDSVPIKQEKTPSVESVRNDKYKRRPVVDEMALMTVSEDPHVLRSEEHYPGVVLAAGQPRSLLSEEKYPVQDNSGYMTMTPPRSLQKCPPPAPPKPGTPHQTYENLPTPRSRMPSEVSIHTLMSVTSADSQLAVVKRESFSSLTSIELTPVKSPEFQSDFARTFRDEAAQEPPPERAPPPPPGVPAGRAPPPPSNISVNSATSTGSDGRAPYYYSDLAAAAALQERPSRARPQLNNQRELDASKRPDIGRKVNQISSPEERLVQVGRIAAQLRDSVEYLEVQKWSDLDERNVYDSDTLKKARRRSHTPDSSDQSVRNIFPDGLRVKNEEPSGPALSHHRRTRSLEGLLEETPRTRQRFDPATPRPDEGASLSTGPRAEPAPYRPEDRPPMPLPRSEIVRSSGEPPPYRAPPPAASPVVPHAAGVAADSRLGGAIAAGAGADAGWCGERQRRESPRHASLRHAQSMESLGPSERRVESPPSDGADPRRVARGALYVNEPMRQRYQERVGCRSTDDVRYERLVQRSETLERTRCGRTYLEQYDWDERDEQFRPSESPEQLRPHPSSQQPFLGDGLPPSFEIDREELRQWDLLSSAPLVDERRRGRPKSVPDLSRPVAKLAPPAYSRDSSPAPTAPLPCIPSQSHADSASVLSPAPDAAAATATSTDGATATPKTSPTETNADSTPSVRIELVPAGSQRSQHNGVPPLPNGYLHHPPPAVHRPKLSPAPNLHLNGPLPVGQLGSPATRGGRPDGASRPPASPRAAVGAGFISDLKAGDLLGRSNEELVLLLIQLRRQSLAGQQTESLQSDAALQHVERLRAQVKELDKQHELTRPLISLVDNMLKLSSLYETPPDGPSLQERRRFSQRVEERRMQREEQRHWQALAGDQFNVQARVDQLFALDQLLNRQAAEIQRLRADKERLERRIETTRQEAGRAPLRDSERLLLQQRALQQELGRVRAALSSSAKSLEDTAAENGRLEREMMMLRQRLQTAMQENSGGETARGQEVRALEGELRRVQGLIDELSQKRWIETDLDSMVTVAGGRAGAFDKDTPLFVNTFYDQQVRESGALAVGWLTGPPTTV
ncbi:uncharacterized protein LOC119091519 [Pollicipes pollicipes]|uniref:uncharacterized protein LOC119091519 n=1 Tax=Pollicipes pollicipes TaxID=41117 RepID=UPI001884F77F|nr:uncharacterized protein LOC119091519 [Pollicipes pollicipes]